MGRRKLKQDREGGGDEVLDAFFPIDFITKFAHPAIMHGTTAGTFCLE
jgi:hypothetical protein